MGGDIVRLRKIEIVDPLRGTNSSISMVRVDSRAMASSLFLGDLKVLIRVILIALMMALRGDLLR